MILLLICIFQFTAAMDFSVNDKNSYGPYSVHFNKYELCELQQEVTKCDLSLNEEILDLNLTVTTPCTMSKSKSRITVNTIKVGQNKTSFRYNLKDPCQHFAIGPMLKDMMQIKKNCRIDKGSYPLRLNLTQIFDLFFGPSFFYGHYEFRSVIRCTAGNLICIFSSVDVDKMKP